MTQNNTTLKQNTGHKATQTIKGTLHTMNTTQQQLRGMGPRANYTYGATAPCWRS
jgi:hypothetical protein